MHCTISVNHLFYADDLKIDEEEKKFIKEEKIFNQEENKIDEDEFLS